MISREEYIRLSLELNLFFGRVMKEHAIFIGGSLTSKDSNILQEAENYKLQYEMLMAETIALSNGVISPEAVDSGELITPFTLNAERATQYFTGISINTNLTQLESGLAGNAGFQAAPVLEQRVFMLNQRAIVLTTALVQFKTRILNDVIACRLFTHNYPLLLDHVAREAKFYLKTLTRLQNREDLKTAKDLIEQEIFWNRIMAEHSKFIRGLLDPTEDELINTANDFGNEFDKLTKRAIAVIDQTALLPEVTRESNAATKDLRDFKAAGTKGFVECNIKSIAVPLIGDHVLREANHYLRILQGYQI